MTTTDDDGTGRSTAKHKRRIPGEHRNRRRLLIWAAFLAVPHLVLGASGMSAADPGFQWRPFLAPFHAVVLHFPIGFITVACVLEAYRMVHPSSELRRVTVLVIWLSLWSGIVAAGFGWLRAAGGGYDGHAVILHRNFGLAVPVLTMATLLIQKLAYRHEGRRRWMIGYRVLLSATLALIVVAGHYGGNLTHGSQYLVENAPKFVRDFLQSNGGPPSLRPTHSDADGKGSVYRVRVQPIFQKKCFGCHGPDKQKGGFRIDRSEDALRGGDSGEPAIVPGDPLAGLLGQLILLPTGDDDAMPPDGKEPLTPEELGTILGWIRDGAIFDEEPEPGAR